MPCILGQIVIRTNQLRTKQSKQNGHKFLPKLGQTKFNSNKTETKSSGPSKTNNMIHFSIETFSQTLCQCSISQLKKSNQKPFLFGKQRRRNHKNNFLETCNPNYNQNQINFWKNKTFDMQSHIQGINKTENTKNSFNHDF